MCFLSFVWRQLEFAFFGALISVGALFYFRKIHRCGRKMSNYDKTTNRAAGNTKEDIFDGMSNESRELLGRALSEALTAKISKIEEEIKDMEMPTPSEQHKIEMNRLFRELVGGSFIPFPEEDNNV